MSQFSFEAKSSDGKVVKGVIEAENEVEARVKIRAQSLIPVELARVSDGSSERKSGVKGGGLLSPKVNPKELQVFTYQLSILISSGVPIVDSLSAMIGPSRSPFFNHVLEKIVDDIGSGLHLADAMKRHPRVFDSMYTNLIKAGEESGSIEVILKRLSDYLKKSVELRRKIKGALFYPVAVILISSIVITAIMTFVIPSFVKLFEESDQELPMLTQIVIDLSNFFVNYWYLVFGLGTLFPILLVAFYRSEEGRKICDATLISVPVLGDLILKGSISRFSSTLATMLSAGVRIVEALDVSAVVSGNYVIEKTLMDAKDVISKGKTISEVFRESSVIPDMVTQMVFVGEQTGNLDAMLERVADFYENEVDSATEALTTLMEPLLMAFLGGVVGVLVVAMYLPVFNLAGALGV